MRPIEFKVIHRDSKRLIGYECLMPDMLNYGSKWAKSYLGVDWEAGVYDGDYYVRRQYTGYIDKNGIKIYEGDELLYPAHVLKKGLPRTEVVKWDGFGFFPWTDPEDISVSDAIVI